ncbi:MAG: prepilin-type N-terminal cleavage/methylation domain-containing protein [Fimbriimonadaceae bacterium]|nr:prepilin-type N-terminal cleavage/methylation domain-containing protein [Fimbriimonadaceae bacterium]
MPGTQLFMRKRGFTLVEIMIVVLIIGIILSIAVPQWIRARERSQARACVSNLRQIESAKEQHAMENNLPEGAPCAMADIWPIYIKLSTEPDCPSGGVYTVGAIGERPTCSIAAGLYPHVLP